MYGLWHPVSLMEGAVSCSAAPSRGSMMLSGDDGAQICHDGRGARCGRAAVGGDGVDRDACSRFWLLVRDFWLPLTLAAVIVAIVVLLIWPGWAYQWRGAGFGASKGRSFKTLWGWVQLFLIPLVLAIPGRCSTRGSRDATIWTGV